MLSNVLKHKPDAFTRDVLLPLDGKRIALPKCFTPDPAFLAHHRSETFVDA